jgi:hypothetical protein
MRSGSRLGYLDKQGRVQMKRTGKTKDLELAHPSTMIRVSDEALAHTDDLISKS